MSNSSTTTEGEPFSLPCHPGEIVREEFLPDFGLTAGALADVLGVPERRLAAFLEETDPLTPDMAIRLGRAFGTSAQYWMNMQVRRDLVEAERRAANDFEKIKPIRAA